MNNDFKSRLRHRHLNIVRKSRRKRFLYLHSRGGQVKDVKTLKRISELRIPPAYQEVRISSNTNHNLQAIGIDNKGRAQYIYNKKFVRIRGKKKFQELIIFGTYIEKIRSDVIKKLKDDDSIHSKAKIIALVVYLMDKCLFRVGNQFYAQKYQTYGTTTLRGKHFQYKNKKMAINFVGKKKVVNEIELTDKLVVPLLQKLLKTTGSNQNIFRYLDSKGNYKNISSGDINRYMKTFHVTLTVKMFRTWAANYIFLEETVKHSRKLNNLGQITDMEAKRHTVNTLKIIANKLHNTPTVSKQSYMNNEILAMYLASPVDFYKKINSGQRKHLNKLLLQLLSNQG